MIREEKGALKWNKKEGREKGRGSGRGREREREGEVIKREIYRTRSIKKWNK